MYHFVKIAIPIALFLLLHSGYYINGKHINRQHFVRLGNPIFCQQKFNACIGKGQKLRQPYTTTSKSCENALYRSYYCTETIIHRNFSAEEIHKYLMQSRSMDSQSGFNDPPVQLEFEESVNGTTVDEATFPSLDVYTNGSLNTQPNGTI